MTISRILFVFGLSPVPPESCARICLPGACAWGRCPPMAQFEGVMCSDVPSRALRVGSLPMTLAEILPPMRLFFYGLCEAFSAKMRGAWSAFPYSDKTEVLVQVGHRILPMDSSQSLTVTGLGWIQLMPLIINILGMIRVKNTLESCLFTGLLSYLHYSFPSGMSPGGLWSEIFMGHYYHIYANGDDARDFITSNEDFVAAFNRVAICAAKLPEVAILAFSIEESHPHFLVYSSYADCLAFKRSYENLTYSYIIANRGSKDNVVFELELTVVDDEDYLLNVAAYVIVQPTKDGKKVMPYDYRWGTASMYFRPQGFPSLWIFDEDWQICQSVEFGLMRYREKRALLRSSAELPPHWLVCNGIVLPSNYVDVKRFESIFQTYNRFRVFSCAGRKQFQQVVDKMAETRGVNLTDVEARSKACSVSSQLFGKKDSRWLDPMQRLGLAKELRSRYHLSIRQIATMSRLPESEIRKYIK